MLTITCTIRDHHYKLPSLWLSNLSHQDGPTSGCWLQAAVLQAMGVLTEKLTSVRGGSYQKSPEYNWDVYRLCSYISEDYAK